MKDFIRVGGSSGRSSGRSSRKSSSARSSQPKRSASKPSAWGLTVVALVGVVLLGVVLLRALHWADFFALNSPQTLLILTEKVEQSGAYVARFDPQELRVDLYPVPSDLSVEVMGGYGTYRFQAVYPLLTMEGQTPAYIRSTMSLSLGTLLDEFWRVDQAVLTLESPSAVSALFFKTFWHNAQVGLGKKLALLAFVNDARTEVVVHRPVGQLPAPEFERFDSASQSLCTAALINTTPLNGLAGRIAALLEQQNFRVVRTVSDTTLVEKTTVITDEVLAADCLPLLAKIENLVPGGVERQRDSVEVLRNRADVVVRVGTDLVQ